MAKSLSGAEGQQGKLNEDLLVDETDGGDLETDEPPPPPRPTSSRDPEIRRKIEDRLERIRLREQLGIYDDKDLTDF